LRNRQSVGLAINRSWVQILVLLGAKLRNNTGQVVHTSHLCASDATKQYNMVPAKGR